MTALSHAQPTTAQRPLRLITGRERDRWHTQTRTGRVAALRRGAEPVLSLHPEDAAAAGLAAGGLAHLGSARGEAQARVALDPSLPRGAAFLPFHAGPLPQPSGWANALTPRVLDPVSFQPELKHTAVRLRAVRAVALAGGALAAAVAAALGERGMPARRLDRDELERSPEGVLRVSVAEAAPAGRPWWEVATAPPPGAGVAVLDLAAGPEPLAALAALLDAGWRVGWEGERWLPEPVRRLVARRLVALDAPPSLRVSSPAGLDRGSPAALVLTPGGRLGHHGPLSGDPAALAALLCGELSARGALRRVVVALSPRSSLVVAGDPLGDPEDDAAQGVDLLVHEDRVGGSAQVWRLTAGQVLGVAAVVPGAVAEDVESLWLTDPDPAILRRRFPVR